MSNVEITKEQLETLIKLSGIEANINDADSDTISKALIGIERKLNFYNYPVNLLSAESLNILIADDMELSIYQLTSMLKKIGAKVSVARTKEEATAELKRKHFDYLILDLFLPDFEDGLELVRFANDCRKHENKNYKILVVSGTDDASTIQKCYNEGIDEFISKQPDWHQNVMKYISNTITTTNTDEYQKYYVNDDICVFTIYKINGEEYVENILKEVNANTLTGKPNIIFDMEHIKVFSDKYANIFAEVFKIATQADGNFIIVKPSKDILNALRYVFLHNVINTFYSIEEAIKHIEESKLN